MITAQKIIEIEEEGKYPESIIDFADIVILTERKDFELILNNFKKLKSENIECDQIFEETRLQIINFQKNIVKQDLENLVLKLKPLFESIIGSINDLIFLVDSFYRKEEDLTINKEEIIIALEKIESIREFHNKLVFFLQKCLSHAKENYREFINSDDFENFYKNIQKDVHDFKNNVKGSEAKVEYILSLLNLLNDGNISNNSDFRRTLDLISNDLKILIDDFENSSNLLNKLRKSEFDSVEYEKININKSLSESFNWIKELSEKKGFNLKIDNFGLDPNTESSLPINFFDNLFKNLTINSIEASQDELSNLNISIEFFDDDNNLILRVKDNASGMDKETLEKVNNGYIHTTKDEKGSGIGLSTLSYLIKNHLDGKWQVKSQKGKGTTFLVSIPLLKEYQNNNIELNNEDKEKIKDLKILILDDEQDVAQAVKLNLVKFGSERANIIIKNTREEVLEYLNQDESIDIFITDRHLTSDHDLDEGNLLIEFLNQNKDRYRSIENTDMYLMSGSSKGNFDELSLDKTNVDDFINIILKRIGKNIDVDIEREEIISEIDINKSIESNLNLLMNDMKNSSIEYIKNKRGYLLNIVKKIINDLKSSRIKFFDIDDFSENTFKDFVSREFVKILLGPLEKMEEILIGNNDFDETEIQKILSKILEDLKPMGLLIKFYKKILHDSNNKLMILDAYSEDLQRIEPCHEVFNNHIKNLILKLLSFEKTGEVSDLSTISANKIQSVGKLPQYYNKEDILIYLNELKRQLIKGNLWDIFSEDKVVENLAEYVKLSNIMIDTNKKLEKEICSIKDFFSKYIPD
jgi:signal transduction histidine kinase